MAWVGFEDFRTNQWMFRHEKFPESEGSLIGLREAVLIMATGRILSLHLHPPVAGEALLTTSEVNAVADKGFLENKRYFGRERNGRPSKRQVTLIEREVIQQHAAVLGVDDFAPGDVRSNIETEGVDLIAWLGRDVQVGEAILRFVEARTPCHKMDALASGLRALMENGRQGVIATVVQSGRIRVGDAIRLIETAAADPSPLETN